MAMGEACSAVCEGPEASYWNPAALAGMDGALVSFSHTQHIAGTHAEHFSSGGPLGKSWGWGLAGAYAGYGTVVRTDASGVELERLAPYDMTASVSLARIVLEGFSVGATAKFIQSRLVDSAQGAAMDLGARSPWVWEKRLRFSLAALNLGPDLRYDITREPLPHRFRAGMAYRLMPNWLWAWETDFPRDNQPNLGVGTEYRMGKRETQVAWRLGYQTRMADDIAGPAGFGMGLGVLAARYSIDYAFVTLGSLGFSHHLSVGLRLGGAVEAGGRAFRAEPALGAPRPSGKALTGRGVR